MGYTEEQLKYLKLMDIDVWMSTEQPQSLPVSNNSQQAVVEERIDQPVVSKTVDEPVVVTPAKIVKKTIPLMDESNSSTQAPDVSAYTWPQLESAAKSCFQCDLHQTRKNVVFGVGNQQTDLLLIGEAPGEQEDESGEPFVGRAGLLLNNMIKAIGLDRENIYIANVLKCRPPNNRDPREDEIQACQGFLHRQIDLIKPKAIAAIGRIAAQQLLETNQAIGKLRGKVHRMDKFDIPIVVTYHPAYLLRKPSEKVKSWQDLKQIHELLLSHE